MPRRREDKAANEWRGKELAKIRAEQYEGVSQYDFAERLNAAAKDLGLPATYRYYTVSRNESGTIGFEDAAVWLSLDKRKRGWDWFIFGPWGEEGGEGARLYPAPVVVGPELFTESPKSKPAAGRRSK